MAFVSDAETLARAKRPRATRTAAGDQAPDAVWGVDVGLARTTICAFAETPRGARGVMFRTVEVGKPGGDIAERLAGLRWRTMAVAQDLAEDAPPLYVFVERPTGKFPNPHLQWATGVVTEALFSALLPLNPHPTSVWHVPVATWKKEVVGHGGALKRDVQGWARFTYGLELDEDSADALAIADYAARQRP